MIFMEITTVRAYAKLNLTLGVLYRRVDGYHALDSIMQSIDLCDDVTLEKAPDVFVTATGMTLPYANTLRKAAERYEALTGCGAHIRVVKRIPAEAGLGGGSADAAAVLFGLQTLYGALDERTLAQTALAVGADVPFCLYAQRGGAIARARGVGEALTPLDGAPLHFVVAKPRRGVSTKALFCALSLPRRLPDTDAAIAALIQNDARSLGPLLFNALEELAVALVPEIGALKQCLWDAGACGASMTGSGSAVFGLFESEAAALDASEALLRAPETDFCCVAKARC